MNKEYQIIINEEAEDYQGNGILKDHFQGFSKTAKTENAIIVVRHVNEITKHLIPYGYLPKGFKIKAKSSDWGVHAGFVISTPELFFLSKIGLAINESQTEKIKLLCQKFSINLEQKSQISADSKINEKNLNLNDDEMVLEIPEEHLQYLMQADSKKNYNIVESKKLSDTTLLVKSTIPGKTAENALFYLEKQANNCYKVYYVFAINEQADVKNLNQKTLAEIIADDSKNLVFFPLLVYCEKVNQKQVPIIPDYDLLAIFWKFDESFKWHQPPVPTNSFSPARKRAISVGNEQSSDSKVGATEVYKRRHSIMVGSLGSEHSEYGNASQATIRFLGRLNKNLGYPRGLTSRLSPVKHSFEFTNPFSKSLDDKLYTFFLPNSELLKDFKIEGNTDFDNKETINYFILDGDNKVAKTAMFQTLLKHFVENGYYVINNCNIEETKTLGLAKAWSFWTNLEKAEKEKKNTAAKFPSCSPRRLSQSRLFGNGYGKQPVIDQHLINLNEAKLSSNQEQKINYSQTQNPVVSHYNTLTTINSVKNHKDEQNSDYYYVC